MKQDAGSVATAYCCLGFSRHDLRRAALNIGHSRPGLPATVLQRIHAVIDPRAWRLHRVVAGLLDPVIRPDRELNPPICALTAGGGFSECPDGG